MDCIYPFNMGEKYLIAVDGPDPDNLALVRVVSSLFGHNNVYGVVLTGRPVNREATKETAIHNWNYEQSRDLQVVTSSRFKNFMNAYGLETKVYDGGIAPHTLVPHHLHFNDETGFGDVDIYEAKKILFNYFVEMKR